MRKDITVEKIMKGGEKMNKSALARQYECCWRTIDRRLNPNKYKTYSKKRIYTSKLDEYKTIIDEKIENQFRHPNFHRQVNLEKEIYDILLNENQEETIKEKFLKYLTGRILKNSSVNQEMIYNTLKRNLNNGLISYRDINYLTNNYDEITKDLKLMFYLKFNIALPNARYLHGMTLEQLSKINVKHINKLSKFLEDKTQDELSTIYGLCIKMYFIFGYERSIEILSGKYGQYNKVFLDNVAKTDITRVEMKVEGSKFLPIIDKRFINFMFETPNNNHFINILNDKNSELYKTWYYLYNNYDEILEKCHNKITLGIVQK